MPKPVRIRTHFTEDAQFLLRLVKAIRRDSRPAEWTEDVCNKLNVLSTMLIGAPPKNES